MNIENLEPKDVFYRFNEIDKIPRESGNEKAVSDFLVNFAKERKLEVRQDEANNVVIKKGPTAGYENAPTVAIQGHMDMVCVKNSDSDHDFTKDPIELIEEDGRIRANGTTLGADDGIAVAMALAVLDRDDLDHGPLEVVITTDEERSMGGANQIDTSDLKAKYLLNIDSEEEGILTVGCAGGVEVDTRFAKEYEENSDSFITIDLKDFEGGHSGMEIDKMRVNAIKALGRLLAELEGFKIAEISGGVKKNSIPTSSHILFAVADREKALEKLEKVKEEILHESRVTDPKGEITIKEVESDAKTLSKDLSGRIIDFLYTLPDGLYRKDTQTDELLTSSNLGLLVDDGEEIVATSFVRSAIESDKTYRAGIIKKLGETFGGEVSFVNPYPGWEKEESELLDLAEKVWKDLTGKDPLFLQTHGGLECGLLKGKMPDTQMISFGPDIEGAHSAKERVNIKSVGLIYEYVEELLKNIK